MALEIIKEMVGFFVFFFCFSKLRLLKQKNFPEQKVSFSFADLISTEKVTE